MSTAAKAKDVQAEMAQLALDAKSPHDIMDRMVKLLHQRMLKYNWVGFYMLEAGEPPMLALRPR